MKKLFAFALIIFLGSAPAWAHCDSMQGPVVTAARLALEHGDVTPVLRWVSQPQEPEVRRAFATALRVRATGEDARELADRWFFETLVRLHRVAEGAPYTGLQSDPPGAEIRIADAALANGHIDELAGELGKAIEHGVRHRFEKTMRARQHADESVEAGRAYVAAYVAFMHYLERVHEAATALQHGDGHASAAAK